MVGWRNASNSCSEPLLNGAVSGTMPIALDVGTPALISQVRVASRNSPAEFSAVAHKPRYNPARTQPSVIAAKSKIGMHQAGPGIGADAMGEGSRA